MVDFEAFSHPVFAVACPSCRKRPGVFCVRPSGHKASDAHGSRKALADQVFIEQHGEEAWIERLPDGAGWRVHEGGYSDRAGAAQLDLFSSEWAR